MKSPAFSLATICVLWSVITCAAVIANTHVDSDTSRDGAASHRLVAEAFPLSWEVLDITLTFRYVDDSSAADSIEQVKSLSYSDILRTAFSSAESKERQGDAPVHTRAHPQRTIELFPRNDSDGDADVLFEGISGRTVAEFRRYAGSDMQDRVQSAIAHAFETIDFRDVRDPQWHFTVRFRNETAGDVALGNLRVPIMWGTRKIAEAVTDVNAVPAHRSDGIIISFRADIDRSDIRKIADIGIPTFDLLSSPDRILYYKYGDLISNIQQMQRNKNRVVIDDGNNEIVFYIARYDRETRTNVTLRAVLNEINEIMHTHAEKVMGQRPDILPFSYVSGNEIVSLMGADNNDKGFWWALDRQTPINEKAYLDTPIYSELRLAYRDTLPPLNPAQIADVAKNEPGLATALARYHVEAGKHNDLDAHFAHAAKWLQKSAEAGYIDATQTLERAYNFIEDEYYVAEIYRPSRELTLMVVTKRADGNMYQIRHKGRTYFVREGGMIHEDGEPLYRLLEYTPIVTNVTHPKLDIPLQRDLSELRMYNVRSGEEFTLVKRQESSYTSDEVRLVRRDDGAEMRVREGDTVPIAALEHYATVERLDAEEGVGVFRIGPFEYVVGCAFGATEDRGRETGGASRNPRAASREPCAMRDAQ